MNLLLPLDTIALSDGRPCLTMRSGRPYSRHAKTWLDDSGTDLEAMRLEVLYSKLTGYTKDDFKEESRIEHHGMMIVGRDVQR